MTERELQGHGYERANICAECKGPLRDATGTYSMKDLFQRYVQPVCNACYAIPPDGTKEKDAPSKRKRMARVVPTPEVESPDDDDPGGDAAGA